MTTFSVWAPAADRVELALNDQRIPLQAQGRDWWVVEVPQASAGMDYAFVLDDSKPLPDPRSPWQPQGVHGPSRLVDHDAFLWSDDGWRAGPLAAGIIYELHVGTFTPAGTFEAVIERLDHLVGLGITHLELMPVAEFSGAHGWGYDGVDLFAPHNAYGGPEGLKRLVNACHARDLAVILDVVYNHLGPTGNYLGQFGPYFTDHYTTPWGEAVNLDGRGSDEVRRFFCDNALMWLRDYHFDGLRIDAVHAIVDSSAIHFLEQLAEEVRALEAQLGRHLVLIAESNLNDPRIVRATEIGGYGLDAQWNDDFHHALHTLLTGEADGYYADFGRLADLARVLERGLVYDGRYSAFRGRRHGRPASDLASHRFVGFMQNHDQVGNRAIGERVGHLISQRRLEIGAALVLTSPFVPMLFQGEEWGTTAPFLYFTDHQEPDLAESVRKGRGQEFAAFGWNPNDVPDPQAKVTFERSKLDWNALEREPHAGFLSWYLQLIEIRCRLPALSAGYPQRPRVRYDERSNWIVVERGPAAVVCNLGPEVCWIQLKTEHYRILLTNDENTQPKPRGITLESDSVAIVEDITADQTAAVDAFRHWGSDL